MNPLDQSDLTCHVAQATALRIAGRLLNSMPEARHSIENATSPERCKIVGPMFDHVNAACSLNGSAVPLIPDRSPAPLIPNRQVHQLMALTTIPHLKPTARSYFDPKTGPMLHPEGN